MPTTTIDTAISTATKLPVDPEPTRNQSFKSSKPSPRRYNHLFAIHRQSNVSPLSYDAPETPSVFGFKNLMALMLIVSNLRLVIENFRKYGVLICISCHEWSKEDLYYGTIVYLSVPCHLLVAYLIELVAAQQAKSTLAKAQTRQNGARPQSLQSDHESFQLTWHAIALAHTVNATLNLIISTYVVYNYIYHPAIGAAVELHAIIVWLKVCSYAFTNRDLRHALLNPQLSPALPPLYASCPYPKNITTQNLCYFWWAPTLIYQPVYPRSDRIRKSFVIKRVAEVFGLSIVIWLATMQYASPLLHNSLDKIEQLDWLSIAERILKLSTISLFCWLCGFYALFHSFLNALAEIMHFADREFYSDWWNVSSVRTYWASWNKPVSHFMRRHIYAPLIARGLSQPRAQLLVFIFSGVLHELLIGVPTHNVSGVAFTAMLAQVPFILFTDIFHNNPKYAYRVAGNCAFWLFFCIFGQPIAAMTYFFVWQKQYGSLRGK